VTERNLEDSFLLPTSGVGSLENLIQMIRPRMREVLTAEGAPKPKEVADVITLLLAYSLAIERVLSEAAGRSGTLPGHSVSVRSYVEQTLSGEARAASLLRLTNYFKDAIVFFMKNYTGMQSMIDQFAKDLADSLRPSQIESRVKPSALLRLFGLHEGVYWKEFQRQFRSLDAAGIKQIVERSRQKTSQF
jgi:hypothetical protein